MDLRKKNYIEDWSLMLGGFWRFCKPERHAICMWCCYDAVTQIGNWILTVACRKGKGTTLMPLGMVVLVDTRMMSEKGFDDRMELISLVFSGTCNHNSSCHNHVTVGPNMFRYCKCYLLSYLRYKWNCTV